MVYFCCGLGLSWIKFQSGLYCDRLGCWLMSVRAWLFGLKGKWNWTNLFLIYNILSILSLSPACSVHGRKLYRFPFLNLALSLLIDLHWSTIYSGMALQLKLELIMCGRISVSLAIFFSWQLHSKCLNHGHAACN